MSIGIGKIRRLQQCATEEGHFIILAMDHRGNLRHALRPDDPDAVSYAEMVAFKREVAAALSPVATAILLDPVYGAAQAVAAGAVSGHNGLVVAVEKTGYTGDPHARASQILPGWGVAQIARMGGSAVKLLVYYHPDAPNAAEQEQLVYEVGAACARHDIPFFLEPLSFSLRAGEKKLPPDERRAVVVETAARLTLLGVDVLKAEFPVDSALVADEAEWASACRELSAASRVPWVLLSAGVSFDTYERQTVVACQAGASGVMAGRAIWKEASTLSGEARRTFLEETAAARLRRLTTVCQAHGRPWTASYPHLAQTAAEGWYATY
jgi:tagatose-1,6-bisphosphate aldolase